MALGRTASFENWLAVILSGFLGGGSGGSDAAILVHSKTSSRRGEMAIRLE